MNKAINLTTILITFSLFSFGQTNSSEETNKLDLQSKAISSDSTTIYLLAKKNIKSDLGKFIKNDTVYYPDNTVLRTSEAKNGYLDGNLIYYNSKGTVYLKSKYKNGEASDTSFYYNMTGSLTMKQAYLANGRTDVYGYYNSGELERLSKIKIVDLTPEELKNSTSKYKQKAVTESEQYFDKKGKEISYSEHLEILKTDAEKNSTDFSENKSNEGRPSFPGGDKAMNRFIQENLVYPKNEKRKNTNGTAHISFTVEKDGSITNVKVLKGLKGCNACDIEAVRVIQLMPKWEPGKYNGQNVKFNLTLPIDFH